MEKISSLNSSHVERIKALLGPRGKKTREAESMFVAEGIQSVREALVSKVVEGMAVKKLYVTQFGLSILRDEIPTEVISQLDLIEVTDQVMSSMSDSQTPQGILALCSTNTLKIEDLWSKVPTKIAYFWQIQDPGNAGTVIRTADACGFDAVVFSEASVDVFNPKVVRATVGSLWHIPVLVDIKIQDFLTDSKKVGFNIFALEVNSSTKFDSEFIRKTTATPSIWIFGNEARGLPEPLEGVTTVSIPMKGFAESLNVASAAAIVMHSIGIPL